MVSDDEDSNNNNEPLDSSEVIKEKGYLNRNKLL
jgi:hypothetical protein